MVSRTSLVRKAVKTEWRKTGTKGLWKKKGIGLTNERRGVNERALKEKREANMRQTDRQTW